MRHPDEWDDKDRVKNGWWGGNPIHFGMLGKAILKNILWCIAGIVVLVGGMFAVDALRSINSPWLGYVVASIILIGIFVGSVCETYTTMKRKAQLSNHGRKK